jgi:hypothetical protein
VAEARARRANARKRELPVRGDTGTRPCRVTHRWPLTLAGPNGRRTATPVPIRSRPWAVVESARPSPAVQSRPQWTKRDDEHHLSQQVRRGIKAPSRRATDESVCTPGSVPAMPWHDRWRPSISACRCRQALAAYPQTRAGSPQASAQATASRQVALLALLRVGFTEPPRSPGMLVGSYPTVSPLPPRLAPRRRSVFCGTVPRVAPGCR